MLLVTVMSSAAVPIEKPGKIYVADYENVLGTSLEIKIAAKTAEQATKAENAALIEIDRLNSLLSGYDTASEFCRWMKADRKPVDVSPELYEVLSLLNSGG